MDPEFWNDPQKAETIMRSLKSHKKWLEIYNGVATLIEDAGVLSEFQKEGDATEEEVNEKYKEAIDAVEDLEFRMTLNQEEDELGAILEINAGAGGTESCDWSEMLFRMYLMWAEKTGHKVSSPKRC